MMIARRVLVIAVVLLAATASIVPPTTAASPTFVIVTYGDSLARIAARTGTSVTELVRANGLPNPNFIYAGQRLYISTASAAPGVPANNPIAGSVYTVNYGDTLATVAGRFGTTVAEVMRVNGLFNPNFIYAGQRLNIPGRSVAPAPQPNNVPAPVPGPTGAAPAPTSGKWIDVDIGDQKITAFQGNTPLKSVLASMGVSWYPTPIGHYAIYMKLASQTMSGGVGASAYYLPGVPWVMYFTGSYAIHGTYWHHNFGTPMSHGCVNLSTDDAKWFYNWAEMGTPVISHP
jgi:lipoprotein-anchoring transpeptidase ErfK/SrfK